MSTTRSSADRDPLYELDRGRSPVNEEPVGQATSNLPAAAARTGMVASLARVDGGARNAVVGDLQRSLGNAALGRLLRAPTVATSPAAEESPQSWTSVERYPFRAEIRRGRPAQWSAPSAPADGRSDAPPGLEEGGEQHEAIFEQLGGPPAGSASAGAAPARAAGPTPPAAGPPGGQSAAPAAPSGPAPTPDDSGHSAEGDEATSAHGDGVPISVPDIEIPALSQLGKTDAVKGAFNYSGSITKGGAAPSGFGVTRSFGSKLTGVTITPKSGTFEVAATLEHPITYQIRSGTGPSGQVDIASETDSDITKTNYPTVASDLTPNMSDLNGRPPRTKFWAEDLTVKHELVHADDDKGNGPGASTTVLTWLNGQTASDTAGVNTLLAAVPARFAAALLAALSTEAGEKHAYGDGAPSYKARADAVKAKGDKGDYK